MIRCQIGKGDRAYTFQQTPVNSQYWDIILSNCTPLSMGAVLIKSCLSP